MLRAGNIDLNIINKLIAFSEKTKSENLEIRIVKLIFNNIDLVINKEHKDRLIIEFTYYDSRLKNLISQYDCQHTFDLVGRRKTLQKRLEFSLSQEAIGVQDLHVEKAQLCNSDEPTRIKELKVAAR